jgi:tetratricopeptide (TPR) repeat protein
VKKPEKVNFGEIDKAVEAYKQATKIRSDPDVKEIAYPSISNIYREAGRTEQAIEAYKEYIKARLENKKYDPSWNDEQFVAKDVNILAVICEEDSRYEEAIKHFQRSIELAQYTSTYFEAYWKIVTLYKKLGKEAEAMRAGRKMLEETERYLKSGASRDVRGEVYEERGLIYEAMDLYKEAIESYKRAADLLRDWVTPHASLYQLYRKMGDKEAAERELAIVKRMNREEYERLMQPLKEPHRIIKIK